MRQEVIYKVKVLYVKEKYSGGLSVNYNYLKISNGKIIAEVYKEEDASYIKNAELPRILKQYYTKKDAPSIEIVPFIKKTVQTTTIDRIE